MPEVRTILFDIRETQIEAKFHGGGIYAEEVLELFCSRLNADRRIALVFDTGKPLSDRFEGLRRKHVLDAVHAVTAKEVAAACRTRDADLLFCPLPYDMAQAADELNALNGTKKVFVVHGLRMLECPRDANEFWLLPALSWSGKVSAFMKWAFPGTHRKRKLELYRGLFRISNSMVVTDSRHSKFSMLTFYPELREEQIGVFYPKVRDAIPFTAEEEERLLGERGLDRKRFFISVGMKYWYKNMPRLLLGIEAAVPQLPIGFKFVLTGLGAGIQKLVLARHPGLRDKLIMLSYVESKELDILYKNAFAHIFPSLNEGYGYPPLEAGRYGTPSLVSAITSIPEICGNGAVLFNSFEPQEIANRILQFALDPDFHAEMGRMASLRAEEVRARTAEMQAEFIGGLLADADAR